MSSLAIPLIETAVLRVLAALGVSAAAGAMGSATSGSGSDADVAGTGNDGQAKAQEDARQQALAKTKAAEAACATPVAQAGAGSAGAQKCQLCPPDKGAPFARSFPVRKPWVDYQSRICVLPSGPNFITEWMFAGVEFDGFDSSQCLLKEAKGGYDSFFDEWGQPLDWWKSNVPGFRGQIVRQDAVSRPKPPVRLEWFWQEPLSYRYFSLLLEADAPDVFHHFQP